MMILILKVLYEAKRSVKLVLRMSSLRHSNKSEKRIKKQKGLFMWRTRL